MSHLERILTSKRAEVEALKAAAPAPSGGRRTLDVLAALRRSPGAPLRLITEIKRKSPSAGALSRTLNVGDRASAYAEAGATMVSVLCDGPFFDGSWDDLAEARSELDRLGLAVPLLAKEFVIDEAQLARARSYGADAVLLIARIVSAARLGELYEAARTAGLEPLVEITNEDELGAALACNARVIGVNARDLDTLEMDAARAARVLAAIPASAVRIRFSGIKTADDIRAISRAGADAALLGEVLMREPDPRPHLRALVAAATV